MKSKVIIILICLVLFCFTTTQAQQDNLQAIEYRIKQIEDLDISSSAKDEWIELLHSFLLTPLNLNKATESQLQILGLDDFQIFSLQHYIKETGELFSLHELSLINGFNSETINQIQPFVCVNKSTWKAALRFDSISKYNSQDLRLQYKQVLEPSKGYTRTDGKGYHGKRFATTLRYNFNYFDRLQFSLVADKDPGEPFFDSLQPYGFDHYSIHLTLKQIGIFEQITLGDYRLNFGEGLAIAQGFSLSYLNTDAIIKKRTYGITPHRSSYELEYNRGIATNIRILNTNLYVFASRDRSDYSGNLMTTGLHRTTHELNTKDSTITRMAGLHWAYDRKGLQIGATAFYYDYKDSLYHQNRMYQQYYFEGKQNSVYAINASYLLKQTRIFSEVAMSQNKAKAMLLGLQFNLAYKTTLSLSYRNYDIDFQNHYANALSVQSRIANEQAINLSLAHRLSNKLRYYAGIDLFHFPFATYQSDTESNGCKIKSEFVYTPSEATFLRLTAKLNAREQNDNEAPESISMETLAQTTLTLEQVIGKTLNLNGRIGYCYHNFKESTQGYYLYLESIFKSQRLPLQANLRYSYFNTENYDTHFSIYEYNLPLSFSNVTLYDIGHRAYLFLRYDISKHIQFSFRYAVTLYNHKNEISSGNDLISTNHKQDIGLQLYFKF